MGLSDGSDGKESACNAGHLGLIPGLERSPGGGHGNPLQYNFLENLQGQSSLAGYSPWGRKELDTTEWLTTRWIVEKDHRKTSTSVSLTTLKSLTVWITTNCGKEMGIQDRLSYLLRNLYTGQEAAVRTRHGTTNWFKIGKEVYQGCISSPW